MDELIQGFSGCKNGFKSDHVSIPGYSDRNDVSGFKLEGTSLDHNTVLDPPFLPNGPDSESCDLCSLKSLEEDSTEENDFSDVFLQYINQRLMEDDLDDKACMIHDSALHAAEKSFYDVLGEQYPSTSNQPFPYRNINSPDGGVTGSCSSYSSNSFVNANDLAKSCWSCDLDKYKSSHAQNPPVSYAFLCESPSFYPLRSSGHTVDGLLDSVVNVPPQIQSVLQFKGGIEDSGEFPTSNNCGIFDFENSRLNSLGPKGKFSDVEATADKDERDSSTSLLRGRKNLLREESDLEDGRSKKHSVVCDEESGLGEMFDKLLLFTGGNDESALYNLDEPLQNVQSKGSNDGTNYTKKHGKREEVGMRTLLIQCAQAVAGNDVATANELLNQIRWYSSPFGDKSQRLSHFFANGLEARLLGTGNLLYKSRAAKNMSDIDMLRAHGIFLSAFPFMKVSNFFATQMIVELAKKASRLHIIHFGIFHGVQWPPLVQRLSKRPGGPPKLRITGIDDPQPGFRPAARAEETGRRLANYCARFNVPFEYSCIAQKWETIRTEDIKIEKDEVLVVISLYRFRYLPDDTVSQNCPRDAVLNLIKRISPDIFIHGICNGTYNSPFLVSRFREALFYYSAMFDMFEANVPREDPGRMVFEREILGKEVLNIIACEGSERTDRPESYKQWQVRILRAGFRQLPLNQEIMKKVRANVELCYHKDFFVDENSQWMLQGWKRRAIFALSCWQPA